MYGELVVGEDVDGRPSPMMASMDRGDLYYRFIVTHGEEDTVRLNSQYVWHSRKADIGTTSF